MRQGSACVLRVWVRACVCACVRVCVRVHACVRAASTRLHVILYVLKKEKEGTNEHGHAQVDQEVRHRPPEGQRYRPNHDPIMT